MVGCKVGISDGDMPTLLDLIEEPFDRARSLHAYSMNAALADMPQYANRNIMAERVRRIR